MKLICRVCEDKNLIKILSLGNIYLSEFSVKNIRPKKYPLTLVLCSNCYLLQLEKTPPQGTLYTDNYGYKSGINKTMQDELKNIVKEAIRKSVKKEKLTIVDIGANDGTLIKNYPLSFKRIAIEPIKKFAKECKKYTNFVINDFFNYEIFKQKFDNQKADIITAISCFYDMPDPNKFVSDVSKILTNEGIFLVQQNYLVSMLSQNAFDNIVHEHIEYYSLYSLSRLLERHNFEVFDVKLSNLNGGSFRTYISKKGIRKIEKSVLEMRENEEKLKLTQKQIYMSFANNIKHLKKQLLEFIKEQNKKSKKVYIYGASTRGNTLLQYFGITKKLTPFAVERNEEKWGKYISSVGIKIISEEQARKEKPDYLLVLPWFFKEEFLKREKEYLKSGGHFIFPLPSLEII